MNNNPIQLLFFEDNPGDVRLIREYLREGDPDQFALILAERLEAGLKHLGQEKTDVILLDLGLPDSQGLETFTAVHTHAPDVPIVVLTGLDDAEVGIAAMKAGAQDYLVKGEITGGLLLRAIRYSIERKQAEEALRESEREFHLLAESMPQIVWITRSDGWNIYFNQQWVDYTGLTLEESYGHGWNKPFHPDDQQQAWDAWQNATRNGATYSLECRLRRADGVYKWWLIRGVPLVDTHGAVLKWFGTCTDINDIKLAEAEIHQLNVNLEKRVEKRTLELRDAQEQLVHKEKLATFGELAGSVAHELRNPLGVISNSVYYLKLVQPEASDKIKHHLTMIEEQTHNAAKIIGDLLDYARVIATEREVVRVDSLVNKTLERFPVPEEIELRLEMADESLVVFADPFQMEQVLGNLVTNAWQALVGPSLANKLGTIKLRRGKRMTISAQRSELSAGQPAVCIQVKDTGIGISPENIKKIFDPLFSTKTQGSGLGLAVSKKLAEANGGRIEVESEEGQGSTFTLYLPVDIGEQA